jgi:hypothetical protein
MGRRDYFILYCISGSMCFDTIETNSSIDSFFYIDFSLIFKSSFFFFFFKKKTSF